MHYSAEAMQFCQSEFDQIFQSDEYLKPILESFGERFIPDGSVAAPTVVEKIETALRTNSPLSILRVGDGEGNVLGMTKNEIQEVQKQTFFHRFVDIHGIEIPIEDAVKLCWSVRSSIKSADIIGFRSFMFPEKEEFKLAIERRWAFAALGILYAREILQQGLFHGWLNEKIITSAWIHLDILPFLDQLLNIPDKVIIITGRSALRDEFSRRLGKRLSAFINVPIEGSVPSSLATSHFYSAFPDVQKQLQKNLSGTLVLVGAGFFGKVYCDIAKQNGAVAFDIGSAFDILAGLNTRPIHQLYKLNTFHWI